MYKYFWKVYKYFWKVYKYFWKVYKYFWKVYKYFERCTNILFFQEPNLSIWFLIKIWIFWKKLSTKGVQILFFCILPLICKNSRLVISKSNQNRVQIWINYFQYLMSQHNKSNSFYPATCRFVQRCTNIFYGQSFCVYKYMKIKNKSERCTNLFCIN